MQNTGLKAFDQATCNAYAERIKTSADAIVSGISEIDVSITKVREVTMIKNSEEIFNAYDSFKTKVDTFNTLIDSYVNYLKVNVPQLYEEFATKVGNIVQ